MYHLNLEKTQDLKHQGVKSPINPVNQENQFQNPNRLVKKLVDSQYQKEKKKTINQLIQKQDLIQRVKAKNLNKKVNNPQERIKHH